MAEAKIYADLKADHNRHRDMLAKLGETVGDSEDRRTLFEAFRVEVTAHAAAEEESLYAEMLGNPDLRDEARHSVSEHKEIDDFLAELSDIDMSSPAWKRKFDEMRHRYEHHIDEEEEEMVPAAAEELSAATEKKLAATFETNKPKEKEAAIANPPGDERE